MQETNPEARNFGMLCHLLALAGLVLPAVASILGPLIIWLMKRDQYPFVDDQGKESLNFQITLWIVGVALGVITAATCCVGGIITFPLMGVVYIYSLVGPIIAGLKANEGYCYRYPFCFRFIK
jgi:uncharacterized protein